jgi:hypothetical protein
LNGMAADTYDSFGARALDRMPREVAQRLK